MLCFITVYSLLDSRVSIMPFTLEGTHLTFPIHRFMTIIGPSCLHMSVIAAVKDLDLREKTNAHNLASN